MTFVQFVLGRLEFAVHSLAHFRERCFTMLNSHHHHLVLAGPGGPWRVLAGPRKTFVTRIINVIKDNLFDKVYPYDILLNLPRRGSVLMTPHVIDLFGNNAIIVCPKCEKPFIVSSWMEQKKGPRVCPHCNYPAGIPFATAKDAWQDLNVAKIRVEHTNRMTFDKKWAGQGTLVQFTADGLTYRYHHDDVLQQIMSNTSAITGTESWDVNGHYNFPRLSAVHKRLLEPYRIETPQNHLTDEVDAILAYLNLKKVRATYGAMAEILGIHALKVGQYLGEKRPYASWIVSKDSGMPSGYKPVDCHPDLTVNERIIQTGKELELELEG